MNAYKFWINVNDVKQYNYCARIPFYNNIMEGIGPSTYGVLAGKRLEDSLNIHMIERYLHNELNSTYKLVKDLVLKSDKLKLQGRLDYALILNDKAYPIEIKYSNNPNMYKQQLVAYSILLEDSLNKDSKLGYFIYSNSSSNLKLEKVSINKEDKKAVIAIVNQIRSDVVSRVRPKPTQQIAKCLFCEFRNFCDDIF